MHRTEEGPLDKGLEALVATHVDYDAEDCRGVEGELD